MTKWAALQELIRNAFNVADSQVSALCRPTCVEAAAALDAAFYPRTRAERVAAEARKSKVRKTLADRDDSGKADGPLTPRGAALMAHGVAMGRLYLVTRLDSYAVNAPDEHGDRPLAVAVMGERSKAVLALLGRGAWPSAPSCSPTSGGASPLHDAGSNERNHARATRPSRGLGRLPTSESRAGAAQRCVTHSPLRESGAPRAIISRL